MEIETWMRIYQKIESDFGFPRDNEILSRNTLSKILGKNFVGVDVIRNIIGKEVYVVGNSPYLEKELKYMRKNYPVIAADDAAVVLYENGITPDIVLTDLDGDVDKLSKIDALFGIHAHGDNRHLLHLSDKFSVKFGTTQIEPLWNVYNFGGFTDGDRCVFLAAHFNARIHLIGFNFEEPRRKEGKNLKIKKKKLTWARNLISMLENSGTEIVWENLK